MTDIKELEEMKAEKIELLISLFYIITVRS